MMHDSATLKDAGQNWQAAADALLLEAERIGPLDNGVFGELGTDEEGEEASRRISEQVDAMLAEGDRALEELEGPAETSADARFQALSFLVASLAVGDALAISDQAPTDVFGELSVDSVQTATFADARATVAEAVAAVNVPKAVPESLEKLESAGATESWKVLSGSVGKLAGGALVNGLEGVLKGAAAAAFDEVLDQLSRWRQVLKRAAVRISKWAVAKIEKLLPQSLRGKVEDLIEKIQEKLEVQVGEIATDMYGMALGRDETEAAWRDAAKNGRDLAEAEERLAGITTVHVGRIAWVTKGRKIIDKFEVVVSAALASVPAAAKLGFAALVAAVLAFVAFQVWDAFNDIEALV